MNDVFCCTKIAGILTFGKTYTVVKWVEHEFGSDPAILCDDGRIHVMWKGFFHD